MDRYVAFVVSRARPNTVRATVSDLRAFFAVVDKGPTEVKTTDVLGFIAEQRKPVMKTVKPLPEGLVVVDEWEECGQGADPMCDGVVLLVDDPARSDPPIEEVRQLLLSRGWTTDGERPDLLRRPRFSSVELRSLEAVIAEDQASLLLDGFLRDHSAEGIAYVFVAP